MTTERAFSSEIYVPYILSMTLVGSCKQDGEIFFMFDPLHFSAKKSERSCEVHLVSMNKAVSMMRGIMMR